VQEWLTASNPATGLTWRKGPSTILSSRTSRSRTTSTQRCGRVQTEGICLTLDLQESALTTISNLFTAIDEPQALLLNALTYKPKGHLCRLNKQEETRNGSKSKFLAMTELTTRQLMSSKSKRGRCSSGPRSRLGNFSSLNKGYPLKKGSFRIPLCDKS